MSLYILFVYEINFDIISPPTKINWRPWEAFDFPKEYELTFKLNLMRVLLDGPMGRLFYLADLVTRQVYEDSRLITPVPTPYSMVCTELMEDEYAIAHMKGIPIQSVMPTTP